MKKRKIVLIVIICILAACGALAAYQRDNISALIKSVNYSDEELNKMMEENKKKLETEISEKYPGVVVEFTEEEEKEIMSGEVTPEEIINKKVAELEKKQAEAKNSGSASENSKNDAAKNKNDKNTEEAINKKIIEFYSLKAYYLGRLGQLEAGVKADYAALPESKRNLVGKKELATKYMSAATSLMNQCDAKVSALLSELESEIKANGGDTSVISTIKSAYENEKNLKKAYYMSKLK